MRFCINYFEKFDYLNEINEVNLLFEKDKNSLIENLKTLIKDGKIKPKADFNIFLTLQDIVSLTEDERNIFVMEVVNYNQEHEDSKIKVVLDGLLLEEEAAEHLDTMMDILKSNNIPFFFDVFVKDWDLFLGLLTFDVSDIYISGQMGFCLNLLKDTLEDYKEENEKEIKLRAICNAAQASFLYESQDNFKAFFIRPEDVEFYSQYIDVLEFDSFAKSINTTYEIYKRGSWDADLDILINKLNISIDNRNLFQPAMQERATCQRKCLTGEKSCHLCDEMVAYAETLEEGNIYLKDFIEEDKDDEIEVNRDEINVADVGFKDI